MEHSPLLSPPNKKRKRAYEVPKEGVARFEISSRTPVLSDVWKTYQPSAEDFPYETNYNDHFETPLEAYQDLMGFLQFISSTIRKKEETKEIRKSAKKDKSIHRFSRPETLDMTLYDPYYCNGRTKVLLHQMGFKNVIHEKRDFYYDIENNCVPSSYHVLITNPPYSDEHKQKCLQYCLSSRSTNDNDNKPFCLLMPNYVASRQYFREMVSEKSITNQDADLLRGPDSTNSLSGHNKYHIIYLVPASPYQYEHLEGTGHDTSPFDSAWFCGLPKSKFTLDVVQHWIHKSNPSSTTTTLGFITASWSEFMRHQGLSLKRPNPRNRRRARKHLLDDRLSHIDTKVQPEPVQQTLSEFIHSSDHQKEDDALVINKGKNGNNQPKDETKQKRSKYRDEQGKRRKKRF